MYAVSDRFLQVIDQEVSTKIRGNVALADGAELTFDNNDIVGESLKIKSICMGDDFGIGAVDSCELNISLYLSDAADNYDSSIITLEYGLLVDDKYEWLPLGIFNVAEPKRTANNTIRFEAYDNMILLDEGLDGVGTSGALYALTLYCCERCGVTFGMTKEQFNLLPNSKQHFILPSDSPVETCRDLISCIAGLLGGFATINRSGELIYRLFVPYAVTTIQADNRYNTTYDDYTIQYNGVQMDIGDSTYVRVDGESQGVTLVLESNPLLQGRSVEDIELALDNILEVITPVKYVPHKTNYTGNPAIDVGDFITLEGGNVKTPMVTLVSVSEWRYRGMQRIEGQGGNPKLKVKETQSQKRLNQTAAQAYGSKETVYFFENAAKRTIRTDDLSIIEIQFAAIKKASPMFHAAIVFKIETAGLLEFTYVIDNTEYPFKPLFNVVEGDITIPLFMPLNNMKENKLHTFEVYLKSADAAGYIAKQQIQAVVVGQGLSAGEGMWDGKIRVSEEMLPIALGKAITIDFTATPTFVTQTESTNTFITQFAPIAFNKALTFGGITENITAAHIVRNHLYTFDSATADSYTYSDRYYFADSGEGIKVATEYKFEGDPQPIDSGYLLVAQVDSARFDGVSKIKVEVE